jgi:predicted transcriptional regulator
MGKNTGGNVSYSDLLRKTGDIRFSYLGSNVVEAHDVPEVIKDVYGTIEQIRSVTAEPAQQ